MSRRTGRHFINTKRKILTTHLILFQHNIADGPYSCYKWVMGSSSVFLRTLLEEATVGCKGVSWRRMFGCDAVFVNGHIFGLIWKKDRLGLKLIQQQDRMELMQQEGAEPWTIGEKTMSHWVLVPEFFHDDLDLLTKWAQRSWQAIGNAPPVKPAKKERA